MQDLTANLRSTPIKAPSLVVPSRLRELARILTRDRGVLIETASITWCVVDALWCAWYFILGRSTSHQQGSQFLEEIAFDIVGIAALTVCLRWMALSTRPNQPGRVFLRTWSYFCLLLGGASLLSAPGFAIDGSIVCLVSMLFTGPLALLSGIWQLKFLRARFTESQIQ